MDFGDVPTWAAAIIAVGAAIVSGVFAGRSASAARRSAAADEGLLAHERTPVFHAEVEMPNGWGGHTVLVLRLDGPGDLDEVEVEVLSSDVVFGGIHHGRLNDVRAHAYHPASGVPVGMQVGDEQRWRVTTSSGGPAVAENEVVLRVTSRAGSMPPWKQRLSAPVAGLPQVH